jgi:coenzyme Q-binding protein COQ10|tara:strand:+ start:218 stop:706 length:489 start_codon:yes stop_codon:yes gene_type:complete
VPSHAERRNVAHKPDDLFNLVADIESYPEFLPWCSGVRVRERKTIGETEVVIADLLVSYKMFRERFRSRVTINRAARSIDVDYVNGPFKHLDNRWRFEPHPSKEDEETIVDFLVDFEFKSRTLERMVGGLFDRAVRKIVTAFFSRADALYGEPAHLPLDLPS